MQSDLVLGLHLGNNKANTHTSRHSLQIYNFPQNISMKNVYGQYRMPNGTSIKIRW